MTAGVFTKIDIENEIRVKTVGQIYKNNWDEGKPAILFKDDSYTYSQVDDQVIAYANFLRSVGVKKGDKVILDTGNSPVFFFSYLGTVRNGATIVPVNPMLTKEELKYIVRDSDAKFIIIPEVLLKKQGETADSFGTAIGLTVVAINEATLIDIARSPREDFDLVEDGDEISTFLYTSGTTGHPKAAMLSHNNLLANARQCNVGLESEQDDIIMCVLPMFHVFAFTTCILLPLFKGATTDIIEAFQPKVVISELLTKNITIFMGVPAMYMVLIEAGKNNITFEHLRKGVCGGAALPVEIYKQVKEIIHLNIIEGYGLTEASPACAFNPPSGVQKPGSIGLPLIDDECIIGGENDEPLPVGEVGELLIKGPNVMQGYYKKPEATAETLRNGWLHTGDLAKFDEDGYIYIVDRKKDLVIVSGLNVYPREVEEVLYQHPKVKDVAVIGVSDKLRGEVVVAYIVLKEGEELQHHKELIRWLKTYLATYKIPRRIEIVEDLPRNSTGKIMKRVLKEQVEAERT